MKLLSVFVIVFLFGFTQSAPDRELYKGHDCPLESKTIHHLVGCNLCKCHQGNLYNCTHFICNGAFIESGSEMVCVEKEMKFDECNLCQCYNNTWICMNSTCHVPHKSVKRSIAESFCVFDGTKRQDECNECVCRFGKWHCSEITCSAKEGTVQYIRFLQDDLKEVSCVPYDLLVLDCSLCQCNQNSVGYKCQRSNNCNEDQPLSRKARSAKIYINSIMEG